MSVDLIRIDPLLQANRVYENIGRDGSALADVSSTYTPVRRHNRTTVRDEPCSKQLFFIVPPDAGSERRREPSSPQGARFVCKILEEEEINRRFLFFRRETTRLNSPTLS